MKFLLERIDLKRDVHFHTNTTIDTLDYSGTGLNSGSKVVLAACGEKKRDLAKEVPSVLHSLQGFENPRMAMPGVVCISSRAFADYRSAKEEMKLLNLQLHEHINELKGIVLMVVCDNSVFAAETLSNYLWITYTRSNPSHDIYGIGERTEFKHWGCEGPLVIDARIKPHHAPALEKNPEIEKRVDRIFEKGGSLYKAI
jgi:4-hydroxy-3-polyprenylbenzoate decarboxylase